VSDDTDSSQWWGKWQIAEKETGHWRIGPLALWIGRHRGEWRVAFEQGRDHHDDAFDVWPPSESLALPEKATVHRFAVKEDSGAVELAPRLADRSVVIRPEMPFHLLSGEDVKLYMSTATWVQILVGERRRPLIELSTFRLSETWFGATTREGELAYAGRTGAHLLLENLKSHRGRAITRVRVRNHGEDELLLERINLPVPSLSLYVDRSGTLWTEAVTVSREKDGHMARVRLDRAPPKVTGGAELVSEARSPQIDNVLVRAIGSFLR
jgi:hypothetical protein